MKPGKSNGSALPRRFRHLLIQLARQAQSDLARIPSHPARAIHALRTRMKKLPAIVHLVESRLSERSRHAVLASAKRLRKAFASQRDAQVAAEMGFPPKPPAKQRPTRPLFQEAARLLGLLEAGTLDGLTRKEVRDAYVRTYRSGRKRMKASLDDPDPALLHAWRKSVKELYYQSLALHRVRGMTRRIRRARRLGRWLGRDHDWELIIERLPAAAKRIKPERNRLRRRIFKLGGKLYSVRPEDLGRDLA